MQVVLTARAEADLEEIFDYIRQDSTINAASYIRQLQAKIRRIARAPRIYAARDSIVPGLRVAAHGHHLIFFRLQGSYIEIVRVIHGARDLNRLFAGD
jgi:toxin ParE1/3/4